jgi:hypothetical protein
LRNSMEWYRQEETRRKTCPSVTFFTTNFTWTDPGANPGLRGYKFILILAFPSFYA